MQSWGKGIRLQLHPALSLKHMRTLFATIGFFRSLLQVAYLHIKRWLCGTTKQNNKSEDLRFDFDIHKTVKSLADVTRKILTDK